ncbi:hypothetical protein GCM10027446_07930 [Angustibacter peucedani]
MAVTATTVAAAVTVTGVLALLLLGRRRGARRVTFPVVWTASLALVTAAGFWLVERSTGNQALALGVGAPGAAIWCAVVATGGRPGALVDPPAETPDDGSQPTTRAGRSRSRRRHARHTRRYLQLVGLLVVLLLGLAVAGAYGVLPWTPWP